MSKENAVEEMRQVAEHAVSPFEEPVPSEEVMRLISRLAGAEMLKADLTLPKEWILQSEVSVTDLVSALREHLSKTGWHRIIEAIHWHNRRTGEPLWDISQASDFFATVKLALRRWEESSGTEPDAAEDWAPNLRRHVELLMESQLEPAGIRTWLLSPRALISRLSARVSRAPSAMQAENGVGTTALDTARMADVDTQRDVALKRVQQLREELGAQLEVFCEESRLPLPRPFSREEAYSLHLLNAYFVALAEAEGVIARRGADLARRQIALEGEWAEARMDSRLLPGLLKALKEVNPLRESLFRERMRHRLALLVGGLLGALGGILWGIMESVSEILVAGVARYAAVVAPALLVFLMTLVGQTLAYSGPFPLAVVVDFLKRALWNGSIALIAAILVRGCWLYYTSQRQKRDM